ncbi:MAG TPA: lysylphosphatidylglycerol synthase transmembrane domain-containing protein [Oligoflexia bacterium]|nr:lysylphosphatidylglycerol synthase transmembrane domain-containing protein [Oligoflexia bacterium]HMP27080.1 lysylphosphatidylglycerol synthase transmembrane domain-containing protein [Oligoflexia bacterium]
MSTKRFRNHYKLLIKIGVSIVILAVIFSAIDLSKLIDTFKNIPLWVALFTIFGYASGQLINSYKWSRIALGGGLNAPYLRAVKACYIGMFVNCFGLGVVGGDITRGALIASSLSEQPKALTSVVADRIHGLIVLCLIAFVSIMIYGAPQGKGQISELPGYVLAICLCFFFLSPILIPKLLPVNHKIRKQLEELFKIFPKDPSLLIKISLVSLFFHLLQISLHLVMAAGIGAKITFPELLVSIPFINIITSLPISWNGLGVRDAAYIFFLTPQILSTEQAVAFGAIWFLAVTTTSCIGGFVAALAKINGD